MHAIIQNCSIVIRIMTLFPRRAGLLQEAVDNITCDILGCPKYLLEFKNCRIKRNCIIVIVFMKYDM